MGEAVGRDDHIVDSIPGDGRHAHKCETNPGPTPMAQVGASIAHLCLP